MRFGELYAPVVNASTEDDLGAGLAEALLNGVDEVIKVGRRWEDHLHDFGVVTGDTVTFDDVRDTLNVGVELLLLARFQLNLDEGFNMETNLLHVDAGVIAGDNAGLFQLCDPGRDRR